MLDTQNILTNSNLFCLHYPFTKNPNVSSLTLAARKVSHALLLSGTSSKDLQQYLINKVFQEL